MGDPFSLDGLRKDGAKAHHDLFDLRPGHAVIEHPVHEIPHIAAGQIIKQKATYPRADMYVRMTAIGLHRRAFQFVAFTGLEPTAAGAGEGLICQDHITFSSFQFMTLIITQT